MFASLLEVVEAGMVVEFGGYQVKKSTITGSYLVRTTNYSCLPSKFDSSEGAVNYFLQMIDPIHTLWGKV